ncbi:hypothetical protein DTO027B5_2315 [Paecilomyces variotii]|nr:hypothetical protein DTO032I3_4065 [Paecilomyces variotii]KAJ9222469.1 hypothetical protein DTO169C6_5209 [Paecilomyces variotii]KAJ9243228.1 hypothetical protein DTO169E5_2810 [Paecilomyces variotii]KAJ9250070.1 hypothetical protein DTO195F2_8274 [Paecilomyces variotii]KAJ9276393.1 hypothetical protein DTO021D3_6739 [Paecilomyces variotii]
MKNRHPEQGHFCRQYQGHSSVVTGLSKFRLGRDILIIANYNDRHPSLLENLHASVLASSSSLRISWHESSQRARAAS